MFAYVCVHVAIEVCVRLSVCVCVFVCVCRSICVFEFIRAILYCLLTCKGVFGYACVY